MGATASTAAGGTRTGSTRTVATDMPQGTAAAAPGPVIVGSLTIAGRTRNVAEARAFVSRTLGTTHPCTDVAVLLCSELVTNAVVHSASGRPGGTVTIVVLRLADAVRVRAKRETRPGRRRPAARAQRRR